MDQYRVDTGMGLKVGTWEWGHGNGDMGVGTWEWEHGNDTG